MPRKLSPNHRQAISFAMRRHWRQKRKLALEAAKETNAQLKQKNTNPKFKDSI